MASAREDAIRGRMAQALEESGLGQEEVANACGVTKRQLQKWLSGEAKIPYRHFVDFARVTEVDRRWLLRGDPPAAPLSPEQVEELLDELKQSNQLVLQLLKVFGQALPPGDE